MISVKNVRKQFGEKAVLENASLEIPDDCVCGIYGESGIGKSTMAKLLCGIYKPEQGEIFIDNQLLASAAQPYDRKLGLHIQMVYQQPYATLDPRQKIGAGFRELIRYHHFASKEREQELTGDMLDKVGLEPDILTHLPHQISGGEAQRVAIARCLLFHPRLLILDEASSMLDVSTQANVLGMIRSRMRETGGSMPTFLIALIFMILFCFRQRWFPYAGLNSANSAPGTGAYWMDRIHHLFLPVLTLTVASAPSRYLLMRNTVSQVTEEKYVLYARERGLSDRKIQYSYIFKNIAQPFITMVGMSVSTCIGGSLVIENIFSIGGMGSLLSEAVYSLDYPLMQGILFVTTAIMTVSIVITDLICIWIDPKVRLEGGRA